jgi:hypothetical protein
MAVEGGGNPLAEALDNPRPAPAMADPGDIGPELAQAERPPFPLGSPVKPLGNNQDITGMQRCYYLNFNGQLVGLEAGNRHGKLGMIALYGPASDWLEANFPQWSEPKFEGRGNARVLVKESQIIGFDQAEAARALVEECVRRGIFDPAGRMRGRGAHQLEGGGLALHCGDKLQVSVPRASGGIKRWQWIETGLHERFVYPTATAIPRPWHEVCNARPAEKLLMLLQTWHWKRPLLDPRFVLGAIGASMLGGALPWRSNIWVTGGSGTGKSTLNGQNGVLHQLFGEGLFRTGNASAAAIRQSLKNSTVPVMFDEIEASADNRRVAEVVQLARVASSGDKVHRGGQDHTAHEFTLQSLFWFSSVLMPPLETQDRNRLAILELKPLRADTKPLALGKLALAELGRKLQRRMVDAWPWLEAVAGVYHAALGAAGHDARGCAQFGWLLACADALIEDWDAEIGSGARGDEWRPSDEHVGEWVARCRPERMVEISEATPDHLACVQHITTYMVQARGSDDKVALGSWIWRAVNAATSVDADTAGELATVRLQEMGLKLVNARWYAADAGKPGRWGAEKYQGSAPGWLAVAGQHQGLNPVFAGTKWQSGVHKQSLSRCPGALEGVKVKFGRVGLRAVLVPLCNVLDEEELPLASRAAQFDLWLSEQAGAGHDEGDGA